MASDTAHYDPEPFSRGAPWAIDIRWLADGVPVDVSGMTVRFTALWEATFEYGGGSLTKSFTGFGSDGEITIELDADETEQFPPSGITESGAWVRYQITVGDTVLMDGNLNVRRNLYAEVVE